VPSFLLKEHARPVSGGKSGPDLHRIVGIPNRGDVLSRCRMPPLLFELGTVPQVISYLDEKMLPGYHNTGKGHQFSWI
jgi:hypothetical protein